MTTVTPIPVGRFKERSDSKRTEARHAISGLLARVSAIGKALADSFAPIGYEDELGFHYGEKRAACH